ncbi:MAG: MT-A70 family methyltransferase [Bryobacteraceae bacterium]|jgi:N6-adenosine-specific RNA methylase IME4
MNIDQIQIGFRYRKELGDLRALADSIAEVGLLHPVVVTPEGRLIAGQRRLQACRHLGWTDVPVTVVDLYQAARGEAHENFVRKDLLPSEIVALKRAIEPFERRSARERQGARADLGHPANEADDGGEARDRIARYLGVGRTTIDRAEAVIEAAEEEPEEYGHLVEQMDRSGKVAGAFRRLTVLKQARELDASPPKLPTGPFQVIVADPPWRYESGNDLPYPTMDIEDIKAMPVEDIADDNATLWLWTTNAHLRVAFDVVDAWGFEFRTLLTWVKDRMGTGEWLRGQTEHCMLAVRGKPVFLHGNHSTVLEAARREHSRKPEEFFALVDATCPGGKVELFCRQRREGWQVYGNDTSRF